MNTKVSLPPNLTPRDMFYRLMDMADQCEEEAVVGYGLFERARYQWTEARERATGSKVDAAELSEWITHYDPSRAIHEARDLLDTKRIVLAHTTALDSIRRELDRIPPASKDFWISLVAGLLANIGFVVLVLLFAMIFVSNPSPIDLMKWWLMSKH
jgi:hypothetical protein